jgi:hypothetical protein
MNSLYTSNESYFSSFDSYGLPYQKINSPNNAGRGYNFIANSVIETSSIKNGSFYTTTFGTQSASNYSIVENEILGIESPYSNTIEKAFFNDCEFNNSHLENSELKNTKSNNSKFEKSKSINSYFNNSVLKDSFYNSDNIIKIYGYDELTASEFPGITTVTFSSINSIVQKVYKFYIDKSGYDRLRTGDKFYIKGLIINNLSKDVINFFDKKFKIGSWVEYTEENSGITTVGKKGYEYSAFLSTPADNKYKYYTSTAIFPPYTGTKFYTEIAGVNPNNKYYSIDIWACRYDKTGSFTTENLDFNYNSTTFTVLNNIIDVTSAFIVDSDFDSGLIENSDWNSGSHIELNNDNNITVQSLNGGSYNLSIDSSNYITATTSYDSNNPESNLINVGNVVFLDSVDFNWGTVSRIPDAYKVISNTNGVYTLQEIGTYSQIISLSASNGYYYTKNAENRYGHLKKLKISKSNIKSGLFRRAYLSGSLIQNLEYNYLDKDFTNLSKIRNLVVSDSIFSDNSNILSNATYINSFFVQGDDFWNSGIIQNSIWNGRTFSNGVIRDSRWIKGDFLNGWFYNSKTFNGTSSTVNNPYYYSENIKSYYRKGQIGATIYNNRNSWQDGNFFDGDFYKSDWELGTFSNGTFNYSKWYDGVFTKGTIGSNQVSTLDTQIYNGTVSYAIVENAALYATDTSYYQNVNQNINWLNGIFINGIFGSNIKYGDKSSIKLDVTLTEDLTFGGYYVNSGFYISLNTLDFGTLSCTFSVNTSTLTFYDDVLVDSLSILNSSPISTYFDISVYGNSTSGGYNFVAKNIGTSYNILNYATRTSGITNDTLGSFSNYVSGHNSVTHSATWNTGLFNGGQFITNGKWKNGTFNGGKFTSAYGWEQSESTSKLNYGWEDGVFNGGEFGNANGLTNSTWYTGEFNNGVFKGRVWNDGIFLYGEFQGSGGNPVSGLTSGNANIFVDSYTNSYWGKWRNGIFTNVKDKFIKDQKFYTKPVKLMSLEGVNKPPKTGKFKNGLWLSGTFSHPNGEMSNSVWLDGAFERGKFKNSSFNPYVKRNGSATASFNFNDDTCYWENGDFEQSDFYISHWKNGNFIIGTASGMIWENGVSQYMNAFNIFWEDGLWRNGNWYGSSIEFNGQLTDDYSLQILHRGMSWSGTSSCHVWNIFLDYLDQEKTIVSATAASSGVNGWVSSYYSPIALESS